MGLTTPEILMMSTKFFSERSEEAAEELFQMSQSLENSISEICVPWN